MSTARYHSQHQQLWQQLSPLSTPCIKYALFTLLIVNLAANFDIFDVVKS
jgi:ABC-type sugar transport system permease subunit